MRRIFALLKEGFLAIPDLFNAIWLFFPAFATVCLIYYILMAVDMAYDTLMITGENFGKLWLTVVATIFWSWVVWFSSRIVSLMPKGGKVKKNIFITHLPRFLAINCFVALQAAILALKHVSDMSGWCIVLYILLQLLFFLLLSWAYAMNLKLKQAHRGELTWWEFWEYKSWQWWLAQVIGIGYVVFLIRLSYIRYHDPVRIMHAWMLPLLSILLFLFQLMCLSLYTNRRNFIDDPTLFTDPVTRFIRWLNTTWLSGFHRRLLCCMGLQKEDAETEGVYYLLFHIVCLISFAIYVCNIFFLSFAICTGPLAFSILALGVLIIFFNLIAAMSIRIDFNLNLVFLAFAFFVGARYPTHDVRETWATGHIRQSMTIGSFVNRWLNDPIRARDIEKADSGHPFIAYIVLSDGGGARAASWSAMLMSRLEDRTHGGFSKHLFSLAGASGGSVGNTAFYGLLRAKSKSIIKPDEVLYPHADSFFRGDFLTYTVGRFLGPDFFNYLVYLHMYDRAAALEKTFEYPDHDRVIADFFASAIDTAYDYSGRLPAFFINTTNVYSGLTGIVSNVSLTDSLRVNVLESMNTDSTLRVSTAAILSARFPFISPAGALDNRYYVDGGYFDNSGAATSEEFMKEVYKYLDKDSNSIKEKIKDKVKFEVVEIHNGAVVHKPDTTMNPLINDVLSPVLTLLGIQDGSTQAGNHLIEDYMKTKQFDHMPLVFQLYTVADTSESYPMSWINSEYQLQRIRDRIDTVAIKGAAFDSICRYAK